MSGTYWEPSYDTYNEDFSSEERLCSEQFNKHDGLVRQLLFHAEGLKNEDISEALSWSNPEWRFMEDFDEKEEKILSQNVAKYFCSWITNYMDNSGDKACSRDSVCYIPQLLGYISNDDYINMDLDQYFSIFFDRYYGIVRGLGAISYKLEDRGLKYNVELKKIKPAIRLIAS